MLQHIAFYRFTHIAALDAVLSAIRVAAEGLSGSVLVSEEGINGTLAGPSDLLDHFERQMHTHATLAPHFADLVFRRTDCKTPPFGRLKISRKRQLVEMGVPPVDASQQPAGSLLSPQEWRAFIARDDVVIIDNRNSFEYRLGRFQGAIDPGVANFRDFPHWMQSMLPRWQAEGKQIGMYCTGGIRCEKTAAWLATEGVHVRQLHGGILNYLQTIPDAERDWQGECFVFDNRIALDSRLQETGRDPATVYEGEADGPWRTQRAQRLQASVRQGVAPSVVLCPPGPWPTVHAFLCERFPMVSADEWMQRLSAGEIADTGGHVFRTESAYRPDVRIVYYRSVQQEPPVPFEANLLFENDRFLIADKPHFLPVAPSGRYVTQTLLVRLRRLTGYDALMPAHRIDRETAGLVLLTRDARYRDAYQALFRRRRVHKVYEAVAPATSHTAWPLQLNQRIGQAAHFMQMEVTGHGSVDRSQWNAFPRSNMWDAIPLVSLAECNARTRISCMDTDGTWSRYELSPETGVRHQLRVQMASLGLPIRYDRMYPVLQPEATLSEMQAQYATPLQLLARSLAFDDPVTGERFEFVSQRALQWPPT